MTEYIVRFVVGGMVVSAFAILGDMLRPRSFGGLLSDAPSVALATLGIAVVQHGAQHAAAESWSMIYGAIALAFYSFAVCQLLMRFHFAALPATILAFGTWIVVAFSLLASFGGAS
jgi:Protein of unknown function (DUF3147)